MAGDRALRDERLRQAQEAGYDFLVSARARAEEFLKEFGRASESNQGRAQEAVDELIEGSRRGTEQLLGALRKEIQAQLKLMGIATKQDLADLEARLMAARASGPAPDTVAATADQSAPAEKAPADATAADTTAADKTPARKTPAARKPAPAKPAPAKKTAAKQTAAKKTAAAKKTGAEKAGATRPAEASPTSGGPTGHPSSGAGVDSPPAG